MSNENMIRQWWAIFRNGDQPLTEVRILGGGKTFSGYYTDVEKLISDIKAYDGYGIYTTINEVKESCYGRSQHDQIISRPKATTSDGDIARRTTLLIDLDPKRSSDTNATDEECRKAQGTARKIYMYLRDQGFEKPVVAFSGNGFHLLYKIDLDNTDENTKLIKDFLAVLDMFFSDEYVDVDTSVFNASRISKLIGTRSNKGTDTPDRPQRMSCFVTVPDDYRVTNIEYIKKVAGLMPTVEQPSKYNGYSREAFDIDGFISEHGIKVVKRSRFQGGEKLILEKCPFDENHKDAAILKLDNGAYSFKCFHNSCQHFTWRDFRLHYDPRAYDRQEREENARRRAYYGKVDPRAIEPVKEDERGKKWLSMADIKWVDPSMLVSIPSGVEKLDRKIMGWTLGDVTIFSGLSGSGKTTFLDFFALNAVQRGYKVAVFSGELQDFRFQAWINQMAAGKAFVVQKAGYDNVYYAPRHISEKVNEWLSGKLFLYNNSYGSRWSQLFPDIRDCVDNNGVQLVMVDNLMTLNLDSFEGDKNEKQSMYINEIKEYAKRKNIHVILVCHPRKEQSFQLLRKESISGTADLTNLCDNLIISHRVGNDFIKRAKDFFGEETVTELMGYDIVLEVAKNRSIGVVDYLIGLYYEPETRRIKNEVAENVVYGWKEEPVQMTLGSYEDMPDFE